MKKTIKKHMVDNLPVYSGRKLSLFSPILADGRSYTSISVVIFDVGCPFPRCLCFMLVVFYSCYNCYIVGRPYSIFFTINLCLSYYDCSYLFLLFYVYCILRSPKLLFFVDHMPASYNKNNIIFN